MKKKKHIAKPLVLTLTVLVFLFSLVNVFGYLDVVYAESDDDSLAKDMRLSNSFVLKEYGEFKVDENSPKYYYIDAINEKDAKKALEGEENFLEKIVGFFNIKDNFKYMVDFMLNSIVNICFTFNRFMTTFMIICLEFAFNFDVVNQLIVNMNDKISGITGISNFKISDGVGLFGSLMGVITLIIGVYILYMYLVKRAFIASASALLKSVLAIAVALLLFSNYSQFLTTINGFSNEVAEHIMGAGSQNGLDESGIDKAKNTLWKLFVDRPYLYLQYGTTDYETLAGGKQRVMNLMRYPQGEDRYEYVLQTEIAGYQNTLMIANTSDDKIAFTMLYLLTNGILSIPVFGLAFVLILLNFWFLIIAAIAPFALVIGIIPIFNGVFKRYFIELAIPLGLKIFFTFFTLFILMMSELLYQIGYEGTTGGIKEFIITVILQIILLVTLFVLRDRIKDIFSSGSKVIAGLRESTGTFKKSVQDTASLAGMAIGAATGGIAGANVGAAIGNATGKAFTGELDSKDVLRAANAAMTANYINKRKNGLENMEQDNPDEAFKGNSDEHHQQDRQNEVSTYDSLYENTDENDTKSMENNDTNVPTETLHDEQTDLPNNNEETLNQNDTPTMHSLNEQETLNNDNTVQNSVNGTTVNNQPSPTLSNLDEDTPNNNVPPTQTTPTNVPTNTENTLQTPNNPVRYNPMEQDGKAQQYESLYNSPIQTTTVNTKESNDTPIQEHFSEVTPIDSSPLNNPSINNRPDESLSDGAKPIDQSPINTEPLNSPSTHQQSTASTPIQTSPMNSVPMNNQSINSQPLNSIPVNSQSIESQPIQNTTMQNQTIHESPINSQPIKNTSSLNSQPIESKPTGSQPIHSQTVDERPINPTQATQRVNNTQQNLSTNHDNPSHDISEEARKIFEQFKNKEE